MQIADIFIIVGKIGTKIQAWMLQNVSEQERNLQNVILRLLSEPMAAISG